MNFTILEFRTADILSTEVVKYGGSNLFFNKLSTGVCENVSETEVYKLNCNLETWRLGRIEQMSLFHIAHVKM